MTNRITSEPKSVSVNQGPEVAVTSDNIEKLTEGYMNKKLETVVNDLKRDFITIFGLFAALIAFLVVEVQIFNRLSRFSLVIGVSSFLLASLLMFTLSLRSIFTNTLKEGWGICFHPLTILIALFLAASSLSFYWYVKHPTPQAELSSTAAQK